MAMSKRTTFTTISTLPPGITREVVLNFLHSHVEMIDLNPLVIERHPISPPSHATPEERRCVWWSLTDKISYLPGGVVSGDITYTAAFNDLANGVQTHIYAPMGTDIRERWSLNGTLPGEPVEPVELGIGAPRQGLYLREDVDLRCNFVMSSFVKKTLKKAHGTLVEKLLEKAALAAAPAKPLPQAPVARHQHTGSSVSSASTRSAGFSSPQQQYARQGSGSYNQAQGQNGQGQAGRRVSPPPQAQPAGRSSHIQNQSPNPGPNQAALSVDVGAGNGSFMPEPLRVNRVRTPSGQYQQLQPQPQSQSQFHSGLEVMAPQQQQFHSGLEVAPQQQRQSLGAGWTPQKPRLGQQGQMPSRGENGGGGGGFRAELE
ncbi:uncharacterized protein GGS22DRAFT_67345 [Annulohypoxylon maeteangense]|uniref:uncharacterized protein n=1 Tax=Annulohypoxylon maeteangense TaxID=1927788 RepID=UPI002008C177|nr:uncharacterized protein GGS22DRAFT_67345 [Annulohypoxylon maeteangense]KAI0889102.1 hypothetical protein GGS22DRAFT_67345 [Annulohypoxylon maeteangense]